MPKILHSTNLCNPTLVIQNPTFCIFFLHRNASCSPGNRRLFLQFFFGSLNLATSDRCPVKLQLGPNNKAETQHATRILPSTITCDQTSGVLYRPIAKAIREPTGRKAELSSKAHHLQLPRHPNLGSNHPTSSPQRSRSHIERGPNSLYIPNFSIQVRNTGRRNKRWYRSREHHSSAELLSSTCPAPSPTSGV
jgi:hypothetical protein